MNQGGLMRNLKVLAAIVAAVLLLPDKAWAQDVLSFTREDSSLGETILSLEHADSGDFNGDGHVDLVIGALSSAQVFVVLGNGDGSFQPAQSAITGISFSTAVADFNNDGRQDLAAGVDDVVTIRLGNGDGTFRPAPDIRSGFPRPDGVVTGDFNRDGAQDLAISFYDIGASNVRIYLGNGDGTFRRCKEIVQGNPTALTVGDFNGDGEQDLAAIDLTFEGNTPVSRMLIALGQGNGTFKPVSQQTTVSAEARTLALGDFDSDGRQDVATADPNTDVLSVVLGNGDGTFQPAQTIAPGVIPCQGCLVQPMAIKVADFNGDGRPDLATGNRRPADPPVGSGVSILLGRGDGTFEPAQEFATENGTASLVVADFNNDGRPDLATANHESSSLTILTAGPMNLPLGVPASSSSEDASSGGGGSFGSELWLLSAIVLGGYARRRRNPSRLHA
jgi:MYXO-CTERM domain-containing protein